MYKLHNQFNCAPSGTTMSQMSNLENLMNQVMIKSNDKIWVAVGKGDNSIAYSENGKEWIGVSKDIFENAYDIEWNGTIWIAVGADNYIITYSEYGKEWIGVSKDIFKYVK